MKQKFSQIKENYSSPIPLYKDEKVKMEEFLLEKKSHPCLIHHAEVFTRSFFLQQLPNKWGQQTSIDVCQKNWQHKTIMSISTRGQYDTLLSSYSIKSQLPLLFQLSFYKLLWLPKCDISSMSQLKNRCFMLVSTLQANKYSYFFPFWPTCIKFLGFQWVHILVLSQELFVVTKL